MELIDAGIYRMVQLSKASLFKNFQGLVLLPNIVANLLQLKVRSLIMECKAVLIQLKEYSLTTADKIKDRLLKKAKGIPPKYNPPLSWLRDNEISLTKRIKK